MISSTDKLPYEFVLLFKFNICTNPWDAYKHGVGKYTYQASTWLILASILPLTNIDSFVTSGVDTSTVTGLAWASVLLFMKSYPENEWRLWFMVFNATFNNISVILCRKKNNGIFNEYKRYSSTVINYLALPNHLIG